MYIRALRVTLNQADQSFNSVSLYQSASYMSFVIPAWLKPHSEQRLSEGFQGFHGGIPGSVASHALKHHGGEGAQGP